MRNRYRRAWRWFSKKQNLIHIALIALSLLAILVGGIFLWASRLTIPTIESFNERRIGQSTKIYDRTGTIVLYDLNQNTRRTVVKFEDIAQVVKDAVVAIEDDTFYEHSGIRPMAFLRALFINLTTLEFSQGGSTITQQVVKNSLLSQEKTIARKIKEWFLAVNLERLMTKNEILTIYLNESPYGSNIYGVEEASQAFFGKKASELNLAEAAYIAAIPQAPTYYSPYGTHKDRLETRKNLVLEKMLEQDKITEEQYEQAKNEKVEFKEQAFVSIKAPHFVMYVKEELEEKYGAEDLATRGLSIITTLNYEMQQKAEEIVKKYALENKERVDAENAGLVVIDPKTGDILTMVGSRDYFDPEIDGNYNVATALRQPGSTFKPFVYSVAFMKGYQPETVVFDVPTEFSTSCSPDGTPIQAGANCYKPVNYDGVYSGPISLRNALAQSKNIPSVKVLYLSGIADSIKFARSMGLTTLKQNGEYGLTLVLGGGEVRLLDLTSAYGVFSNEGVRNAPRAILSTTEANGNKEEAPPLEPTRVLDENIALKIGDILTDNAARSPAFGANSPLYIPGKSVAAKTGTTDDYRDTWIIGYSSDLAVGAWAGNNDNRPIDRKVAGMVVAPMWRAFMDEALKISTSTPFKKPIPDTHDITKPIILGRWTPAENGSNVVHDILHYVDRTNPLGPAPINPQQDSQYDRWEYGVQQWVLGQFNLQQTTGSSQINGIFGTSTNPILPPGAIIAPNQNNPFWQLTPSTPTSTQ